MVERGVPAIEIRFHSSRNHQALEENRRAKWELSRGVKGQFQTVDMVELVVENNAPPHN